MFLWLYEVPLWLLGVCFAVLFVGLTWAGILSLRPWVRRWAAEEVG